MTGRMANHKHSCFLTIVCSQSLFSFPAFWSMSHLSLLKGLFLSPLCCHGAFQSLQWHGITVKAFPGAEDSLGWVSGSAVKGITPTPKFSLYLVLRIFLSLFYLLMLQHILFRPSHYLLKLPWIQTDNLIPCPCFQEERGLWVSLNTVAPCWNGSAADQTTTPQKEFGFLSCCTHLTFSFLDWTYTIYFILSSLNKYFNSRGFKIWFCSLNKLIRTINYYNF